MIKYFFSFFLFFTCCYSDFEFSFKETFIFDRMNNTCINNGKDCFKLTADKNLNTLYMSYFNIATDSFSIVDSIEFSSYNSMLHTFKSQDGLSLIVLWETEFEYFPIVNAYFITSGKILKMGQLDISLPCESCEHLEYPIKETRIFRKDNKIEMTFLKDVNYVDPKTNKIIFCKSEKLKYIFNQLTNEFKPVFL